MYTRCHSLRRLPALKSGAGSATEQSSAFNGSNTRFPLPLRLALIWLPFGRLVSDNTRSPVFLHKLFTPPATTANRELAFITPDHERVLERAFALHTPPGTAFPFVGHGSL